MEFLSYESFVELIVCYTALFINIIAYTVEMLFMFEFIRCFSSIKLPVVGLQYLIFIDNFFLTWHFLGILSG